MSFPLSSARFSGSAFSSVFHGINPSAFKKQKKVPSALTEVGRAGLPGGERKGSWEGSLWVWQGQVCPRPSLACVFGTKDS